jgi:hypothetical protein
VHRDKNHDVPGHRDERTNGSNDQTDYQSPAAYVPGIQGSDVWRGDDRSKCTKDRATKP